MEKSEIFKGLFIIGIVAFCIFSVVMYFKAPAIGEEVGSFSGTAVGTAVGSFTGVVEKFPEGWNKGKEEGLSAVDTVTEIENSFNEIAKLEVLVSSFKLNDYHKLENKYAALYLFKADAVFTIDLSKTYINANEDGSVYIRLPQPEVTVYIDNRSAEKIVEYQRKFFNGNAEDGFDAYINSMSNLEVSAQNSIKDDENLMRTARNSAEKQIKQLAENIFVNGEEPLIIWE